jgi:hypothetical protein
MLREINRSLQTGRLLPDGIWIASIVLETSLPAVAVALSNESIDPTYRLLANPAVLTFFLFKTINQASDPPEDVDQVRSCPCRQAADYKGLGLALNNSVYHGRDVSEGLRLRCKRRLLADRPRCQTSFTNILFNDISPHPCYTIGPILCPKTCVNLLERNEVPIKFNRSGIIAKACRWGAWRSKHGSTSLSVFGKAWSNAQNSS